MKQSINSSSKSATGSFPLSWENLWEATTTPYATAVWSQLSAPWELLRQATLAELLQAGSQRQGVKKLTYQGITSSDQLFYQGEWVTGEVRVEQASAAAKGEMACYHRGKLLKGASYVQAGVYLASPKGELALGDGCFLQSGAYLEGVISLGAHCEVRQGAFVRGNVLAGNSCILGHSSELKNVIMHDHAKAAHFAYVGDSILGAAVNLGAGTKVSNLKIQGSEIIIKQGDRQFNTGMRKLGAILGDQVETGCNSVLNPGAILAKGCCVYPTVALRAGIYPPGTWLKETN